MTLRIIKLNKKLETYLGSFRQRNKLKSVHCKDWKRKQMMWNMKIGSLQLRLKTIKLNLETK